MNFICCYLLILTRSIKVNNFFNDQFPFHNKINLNYPSKMLKIQEGLLKQKLHILINHSYPFN